MLLVTLIGFFSEGWSGIPTWLVAAGGAATLLALHSALGQGGVRPVFRRVGWDVVLFLCGMFVVGMGLRNVGFTHMLGDAVSALSGGDLSRMRLSTGLLAGICSAFMNNHPIAGMMAWVIQDFSLPLVHQKFLAFAALIGGDLGPKMLPIGSLAYIEPPPPIEEAFDPPDPLAARPRGRDPLLALREDRSAGHPGGDARIAHHFESGGLALGRRLIASRWFPTSGRK